MALNFLHFNLLKTGTKIDASLPDSLQKLIERAPANIAEKENEILKEEIEKQSADIKTVRIRNNVDEEGRLLKKIGRLYYGLKKHFANDDGDWQ